MRPRLPSLPRPSAVDVCLVLGVGLVVAGLALWSVPAAMIAAGLALVAVGGLLALTRALRSSRAPA